MRPRDRVSAIAGIAALATAVLAVGGALRWAQALVAALIAIALAAQVSSNRRLARISPLIVVLAAAAVLTALQIVPLPRSVLDALEPMGNSLREDGAALAHVSVMHALTLDTPGTLRGLTFFLTLLGGAVLALRFSASEGGRHLVLGAVAAVCGLTALVVGIHQVFDATSLYGLYEPQQATPTVLGPLLNPNHLGCLMATGTVLSVALLAYHRQSTAARVAWAVCAIACAVVTAATLSRGAVLAGAGGLAVVLGALASQRWQAAAEKGQRARRRFATTTLPLTIIIMCGVFVTVFFGAGGVVQQIGDTSLQEIHEPASKFAAWRSSEQLVEEAPLVGVGRGAFEPAFTRVHPPSAFVTFSHPENEYVQAVVEWGIPGAAILAALCAWLAVVALRRWRDGPFAAGALGALVVIAAQSNVDFGLELLGIALPAVAIAATIAHVPFSEISSRRRWKIRIARGVTLGLLGFAVAILCMPVSRTVQEDHATLHRKHIGEPVPIDEIRDVIARHPLDYYAYAVGAQELAGTDLPEAIRYLGHALVLHPTHPGLHQRAANLLRRSGRPKQAAVEYAAALEGSTIPIRLLREIVVALPDANDAAAAIPVDYRSVDAIVLALDDLNRNDVSLAWLEQVQRVRPTDLRVIDHLLTIAMSRNDLPASEQAARAKLALIPTSLRARLDLARVLSREQRWDESTKLVADVATWNGRVDEIGQAWLLLCDASIAHQAWDDAAKCLHQLDAAGVVLDGRDQILRRLATVEQNRRAVTLGTPLPPAPVPPIPRAP